MMNPTVDRLVAQGKAFLGLRRNAEGLECFEQALSQSPEAAAAMFGKCQALTRLGRADEALNLMHQLLEREPDCPGAHGIQAQVLYVQGRKQEAWDAAQRGCVPGLVDPVALLIRGLLLLERGDAARALAAFDDAVAADPTLGSAHQGRASALESLGRVAEALRALDTGHRLDPNNPQVLVRAGHLMIRMNWFDLGLAAFTAAVEQQPAHADALQGQAQCLAALGRAPEAVEAYTRLLAAAPDADYMHGERMHVQMQCCDWREFEANRADIAARVRRGERVDNPGSFMTHSDSPADQLLCARTFAADFCAIAEPPYASYLARGGERLRVAYVSADFSEHATAYLTAGLFEAHDRAKFEIYAVSFGPDDGSAMRRRLVRAFDHFEDVRHLSDQRIAALLHEQQIDIAVDLKGHTLGARPRIFAHRPAPLQVSFLAYPGTMGADYMDYVIADRVVIPDSERIHYAEQVIYMPGSYQVNDSARTANPAPSRGEAGLPESGFVFCCFNSSYKIAPPVFDDWMEILKSVPGSVLWLLQGTPAAVQNLRAEAMRRGVDADRLIFAPWKPPVDHLARCGLADLFLDTLPYNAHTTASDALWSGVPVVTRAGATFASRVATSLVQVAGLGRLSVSSREEYRSLAIRIAGSPGELRSLKESLARARDRSRLFDSRWYCRQLEAAFEEIVARRRRGEVPTLVDLPEISCHPAGLSGSGAMSG